jgi:HAD superfamily hydrolase (TIGR01509 family)
LDAYKPYMGTKTGWADMIADYRLPNPAEHYSGRYREIIIRQYREKSAPLPGAVELVTALRRAGIPIAVCSSSIRPWVDACLEKIGLAGQFNVIVTGGDIDKGKPAPDIYLLTAERLGIKPARCLAIEDAPAGILSAKAAGMTCWAVRTEYTRDLELPAPHRELQSLLEVDISELAGVTA